MTTTTTPFGLVRLFAVLAAAALVLSLLPAAGVHADEHEDDDDNDAPDLPLEPPDDNDNDDDPDLIDDDGDEPRVTEFEGERGTIVDRSGDGLLPSLRYRGTGRHDTARLIATDNETFHADDADAFRDADEVIVARADDFPDSLAGATLAGAVTAPVLLVDTAGEIQADTQAALDTIEPSTVFALGGTSAISEQVENDLEALDYVDDVERIAGATRFETAAEVALRADEEQPIPDLVDDTVALLATGEDFADALAGGQVAYAGPFPLLLTPSGQLAEAAEDALAELEVDRVLVLGGSAAVSDDVVATLDGLGFDVDRLAGRDRTVTAVEIAEFALEELDFGDEHVNLARGNDFADALAVAPHAGEEQTPLLISATENALGQEEVADFFIERGCTVEDLHVSGGFAALTPELEQEFRGVATGAACDIEVVTDDQAVDAGEAVDVEADVFTSLGESSTAGVEVAFDTEAQVGGDDDVACEPQAAETDESGRATCTLETDEDGLYEITATVVTAEGEEASDSVTIGVGAGIGLPDDDGEDTFGFEIASAREVGEGFEPSPNPIGPAGGDASGQATLEIDLEENEVCLQFLAAGTEGDFEAFNEQSVHVHVADDPDAPADLEPFAINGPVEIAFSEHPDPDPVLGLTAFDDCADADEALLQAIVADPGEYYVNAHTDLWPGGNLRGQIDGSWDEVDRSDDEPADPNDN